MPTRTAKADWQGEFKRGGGTVSTETGVLEAIAAAGTAGNDRARVIGAYFD